MWRKIIFFILFCDSTVFVFSQSSYLQELDVGSSSVFTTGRFILQNRDEEHLLLAFPYLDAVDCITALVELDSSGNILWSKGVELYEDHFCPEIYLIDYEARGDYHVFLVHEVIANTTISSDAIVVVNPVENTLYGFTVMDSVLTYIGFSTWERLSFFDNDVFVFSYGSSEGDFSLSAYSVNGQEQIWSYDYFLQSPIDGHIGSPKQLEVSVLGQAIVLLQDSLSSYLVKISENGEVLHSVKFPFGSSLNRFLSMNVDASGNIYLAGYFQDNGTTITPDPTDGFILKFDMDFNFLWGYRLLVAHFRARNITVTAMSDDGVQFVYAGWGDLPVISGRMSGNGEILWYRGYSFYAPALEVGPNGSVYFYSWKKYYEDGSWDVPAFILAKTTPEGNIENCPQYTSCLDLEAISFEIEQVFWGKNEGIDLTELEELSLFDLSLELSPHCGSPVPPTPYFTLPDTICLGDCLSPDSTYNRLAHQVEWYISGPGGLDTTIVDTTFNWCFEEPGTYEVEQGVWLLGCSDFYQRELVVLSDEVDLLEDDRILCEDPPYSLSANAGRPLVSYIWSDGSTNPELSIITSGSYSLEALDGYCTLRDSVQLIFLQDLLTQGPPLSLPEDTTVCEQHLPYLLQPYSPYTEVLPVQLWEAGVQTVEVDVFGCPFTENFELGLSDCRSRIYFPTAFSPNGDGINDLFLPQGKDYEGIELQIYDRWGGLLFSSREEPFAWSGDEARPGVYTYLFRYLNTLSGKEEAVSGEVVLVE